MALKNRTELKAYFETGDTPTEAQFIEMFDALYVKEDDKANIEPEHAVNKPFPVDADKLGFWDSVGLVFSQMSFAELKSYISATLSGGHVIKNNAGTSLTDRVYATFKTNGTGEIATDNAGANSTDVSPKFNLLVDVDPTGLADQDLFKWDVATSKFVIQTTTPFIDILMSSEANISANGILSTTLLAGYKIDTIILFNQTANAAGDISIGTAALGAQIVNAATVGASATIDCILVEDFFSTTLDTDLYISSSAWGTGIVTIYLTFKKVI